MEKAQNEAIGWPLHVKPWCKGTLEKEIESYGVLHLTSRGTDFISSPKSFMMTLDHTHEATVSSAPLKGAVLDKQLMQLLKAERKKIAQQHEVPPYAVFQENSLEDMALKYPVKMEELITINGVGEGKAKKFGASFLHLIEAVCNRK